MGYDGSMRIVIAGGHGQIALLLSRRLADRGDPVVGLIRNPAHAAEVMAAGAEPATADLESVDAATLAEALRGADAVVFAAGAGPGSGIRRKDTVDRAAAGLLADAAQVAGVRRYLLVSSIGVDRPATGADEVFAAYLRAKAEAERDLRARDLDWTILRPGGLTNDPATGRVRLEEHVDRGQVPRDDVAAVLVAFLDEPRSAGKTLELVSGDTPIAEAVSRTID
jgi:uncharacterized protein YbjT (DUF2867 family)